MITSKPSRMHHSPCSLGCWTNNTLAARSLSPNQHIMDQLGQRYNAGRVDSLIRVMAARHPTHAGHSALWGFYRDIRTCIQQSLWQINQSLRRLSVIPTDCKPHLVPKVFYGVSVGWMQWLIVLVISCCGITAVIVLAKWGEALSFW